MRRIKLGGLKPPSETAQFDIELLQECNRSLHELCDKVWHALEPTGEYEGEDNLVEFAESVRAERDKLREAVEGHGVEGSEIADELVAARTAWLESFGVPISHEFGRFAEAIGKAVDKLRQAPPKPSADLRKEAFKADTLFGIWCDGKAGQGAFEQGGVVRWENWQRLANWLNGADPLSSSTPPGEQPGSWEEGYEVGFKAGAELKAPRKESADSPTQS